MLLENAQTIISYTRTKLGTNSVTSKVWLRNPTNIKLPIMLHALNQAVQKITLVKQIED